MRIKYGREISCEYCGKVSYFSPSRLKYKKHFCSKVCKSKSLLKEKVILKCDSCDIEFGVHLSTEYWNKIRNRKHRFCSRKCETTYLQGERSPGWTGGRFRNDRGYILIYNKDHPRPVARGYVYEHILVVENILGRYLLLDEHVHHKNGVRDDNRIENLEILTSSKHAKLHHSLRKRDRFGRFSS